ncbi:MAG TPA: exodeoxyribonuclease VII small subunit [Candidatus Saccharimonadales bacterium]|jgi:exodeoxyribonuclease VII small subunit|nr:exodeoxyribonuclease VII small subunit [Candidatus Saccharimonadales bacterium]
MVKNFVYRDKKDELEKILSELQSPELNLEEAITKYKTGNELIKEIEEYLNKAKNTIIQIRNNKDN